MNCLLSILLLCFSTAFHPLATPDNPDAIVGRWLSSKGNNQVQIFKQGNHYVGRVIWMRESSPNYLKTDRNNPDPALRDRPVLNLVILTNLRHKGQNVWSDGQIYNPEDGRTYGCEMILRDANSLDVRGYMMGMPFLGKTRTWTRVR